MAVSISDVQISLVNFHMAVVLTEMTSDLLESKILFEVIDFLRVSETFLV